MIPPSLRRKSPLSQLQPGRVSTSVAYVSGGEGHREVFAGWRKKGRCDSRIRGRRCRTGHHGRVRGVAWGWHACCGGDMRGGAEHDHQPWICRAKRCRSLGWTTSAASLIGASGGAYTVRFVRGTSAADRRIPYCECVRLRGRLWPPSRYACNVGRRYILDVGGRRLGRVGAASRDPSRDEREHGDDG